MWSVLSTRVKPRTLRRKARRDAAPKRPPGHPLDGRLGRCCPEDGDLTRDAGEILVAGGEGGFAVGG